MGSGLEARARTKRARAGGVRDTAHYAKDVVNKNYSEKLGPYGKNDILLKIILMARSWILHNIFFILC